MQAVVRGQQRVGLVSGASVAEVLLRGAFRGLGSGEGTPEGARPKVGRIGARLTKPMKGGQV